MDTVITISKNELCAIMKQAVKEALQEETLEFFMRSIPWVPKEEMKNIENLYGKPSSDKKIAFSETIEI